VFKNFAAIPLLLALGQLFKAGCRPSLSCFFRLLSSPDLWYGLDGGMRNLNSFEWEVSR